MGKQICTSTAKYLEFRFNVRITFLVNSEIMVRIVHTSNSKQCFSVHRIHKLFSNLHLYIAMLLHLPDMPGKLKIKYNIYELYIALITVV